MRCMQLKDLKWIQVIGLLFTFILMLVPFQTSYSTTFVVDDNRDIPDAKPGDGVCKTEYGTCSLRAAIHETNLLNGPNTINIPAMTIVLDGELRIVDHSGDDSVHIIGAGMGKTIIDGNNKTRVFYFAARSGSHSLSDLTIRSAKNQHPASATQERNGGGVFNEATLSMTNVRVTRSKAFQGGGVFNQHDFGSSNIPMLTLDNVILDNNTATSYEFGFGGGGLFNGSVLEGTDVKITDNTANQQGGGYYNNSYKKAELTNFEISGNSSMQAAGIDNDIGKVFLTNGKITGNKTNCCIPDYLGTGGAGIFNNDGNMIIKNVDISHNVSDSPGGFGGGIYNFKFMTLENVSVTYNQAAYGAGIDNGWSSSGYENNLTLINVTISNNVGPARPDLDTEGAAIHNRTYGTINIYNTTITQNSAECAGGITNRNPHDSIFIQNTILSDNSDDFGADDCRGVINSNGHNIIGNPTGSSSFPCTVHNMAASDLVHEAPRVASLQGDLAYHPLLDTSPAIENGTMANCPATDIRGFSRPAGDTCDIGAYEADPNPPVFLPSIVK